MVLTALHLKVTLEEAKVEPGCGLNIMAADPGEAVGVGVAVGVEVGAAVGVAEGVGVGVGEVFGTR